MEMEVLVPSLPQIWGKLQLTGTANETNTKLAKVANVGKETYRQAKKILDSGDEDLKKAVMSQETNIRQRGDIGGSAKKVGLRINELERLYGIHQGNGSNQYEQKTNNSVIANSQEQLATRMKMSVDTLQNYKLLTEMIPELEELLDTGIVTKTTVLAVMKQLSEEEPNANLAPGYHFGTSAFS